MQPFTQCCDHVYLLMKNADGLAGRYAGAAAAQHEDDVGEEEVEDYRSSNPISRYNDLETMPHAKSPFYVVPSS